MAKTRRSPSRRQPALLSGFQDQGVFSLYLNEERIGTVEFKWQLDGGYQGKKTLSMAGQSITTTIKITPDATGRWMSIVVDSPLGPITITRKGVGGHCTFKNRTTTCKIRPNMVIYDNASPALMSHAIRMYDKSKGGKQTFPLFIVPGDQREVDAEAAG